MRKGIIGVLFLILLGNIIIACGSDDEPGGPVYIYDGDNQVDGDDDTSDDSNTPTDGDELTDGDEEPTDGDDLTDGDDDPLVDGDEDTLPVDGDSTDNDTPELDEDDPPVCTPPCTDPNSTCIDSHCECIDDFHDGGDGACVEETTCSNGYAIAVGSENCIPLANVCPDEHFCKTPIGWSNWECQYQPRNTGQLCLPDSITSCHGVFACNSGGCAPVVTECQPAPRPIIFMHGINGSSDNWNTMIARLIDDGWPAEYLLALDAPDPSWGCNRDNADMIAATVDQMRQDSGYDRIDLVAHSMGTLSSRYYMKFLGGSARVNTYLTLGGMHHGLTSSCYAPDFLNVCVWQEICETGQYVADLNAPPATPGCTHWVSMYGTADTTVPNDSSHLEGAENISFDGVEHSGVNGLLEVEDVYREVKRVLSHPCW